MKKTTTAFIAALLTISLALLSACNSTVPTAQPGEVIPQQTENNSTDESIPDESSDLVIENDVSANMGDTVDIPPLGTPTKLIPIVEFGFGDGDYELGYSAPDEYGFITGPNGFYVNGNEILVDDQVNHRLLVYRDGKLIDKVDISDYPFMFNCTLTDDYYYIVDEFGSIAYRIDRQTKEFEEIDFETHDCSQDNDYTWSFKLVKVEGKIYIRGRHSGDDDVCYLIDGAKAPAATFPLKDSTVSYTNDKYILDEGNSQKKTLELIKRKNGIYTSTGVIAHKDGATSMIYQSMTYRDAEKKASYYDVYYKLSSDGTVMGRYIQFVSDDSFKPAYRSTLNSSHFRKVVTDSGDLFVVNGDNEHVGIYKVEFGMDEIPFNAYDEAVNTQGDLHNVQSPTSTSEDMTYHPRVSRQTAEQRALQMINLKWTLKQSNKQQPADCNHDEDNVLIIPTHVLNASVGTQMTGITYCVTGGNGLEYLSGSSASKGTFLEAINNGKIAGNVGEAICNHAAGLDCSGYASSVYKLNKKYYSGDFLNAGINLGASADYDDLDVVLDRMDLLVQMGVNKHILIFIEQKNEEGVEYVHFYNCTRNYGYSDEITRPFGRALKGKIEKYVLKDMGDNFTIHKMWNCEYVYTYVDSTQHKVTRSCGVCDTTTTYNSHMLSPYSSYNGLYHAATCRQCSGRVLEAHKYLSPTGPCKVCGYNGPRPVDPGLKKTNLNQNIALTE